MSNGYASATSYPGSIAIADAQRDATRRERCVDLLGARRHSNDR